MSRGAGPGPGRGLVAAILLAFAALLAAPPAGAAVAVPKLTSRVVDGASLLDAGEAARLRSVLETYERETRHQVVVLTVPSLEGESIEGFGIRVAEAWKIGTAEFDDGVILIVAAKDRRARIEVGYGLEGVIPDAVAARILRDHMIPEFRRGAMGSGISAGVAAILKAGHGEALPPAPKPKRRSDIADRGNHVMFAAMLGAFAGNLIRLRKKWLAPIIGAGCSGLLGFLLSGAIVIAVVAGFLGAFAAMIISIQGAVGGRSVRHGGFYRTGGFGGGGFGGGFGGGGGGFGGGGASGGW